MPWACAAWAPSITARPRTAPRIVLFMEISSQRVGCWKARSRADIRPGWPASGLPAGCFKPETPIQAIVIFDLALPDRVGASSFQASIARRLRPVAPRGAMRCGEPQELGPSRAGRSGHSPVGQAAETPQAEPQVAPVYFWGVPAQS